ncbi:MAG: undecaprenyl diphosphate synthase family protein, partial [Woeseiales bacterium]
AFSSENWQRPAEEVSRLMGLFLEALQREVDSLHRNNVQLSFIGSRDKLDGNLIKKIVAAEDRTRNNSGLKLMIAVAYGGRWDIINATKSLAQKVVAGQLAIDEISDDDCLWPDFDAQHFDAALAHFASRQRRYGHTGEQVV